MRDDLQERRLKAYRSGYDDKSTDAMSNLAVVWPVALTASAIGVAFLTFVQAESPMRAAVAFWFLLACPGMAFVRVLGVKDALAEWTLAIALSLVLDTLVAEAMLFAGVWSPAWGLGALIGMTGGGIALQLSQLVTQHDRPVWATESAVPRQAEDSPSQTRTSWVPALGVLAVCVVTLVSLVRRVLRARRGSLEQEARGDRCDRCG